MKDEAIAPYAPIRVTVEFSLTDGNQVAQASFGCRLGHLPTEQEIAEAAVHVLAQVQDQLGETFFFQNRHAFVADEMAERTGGFRLAIPGPDVWQAAWAEGTPTQETQAGDVA